MIAAPRLLGRSLERAELYGKPHVGCRYTGEGARCYERTREWCFLCGRPAQSCHHVVPRSQGERFRLVTSCGTWELRSALFCLCGGGTTGCHDGFHGGARYRARWVWDDSECEAQWWDGLLLARHGPHDPALYWYGCWEIEDLRSGKVKTVREEPL